jgi:hypothetical protein
MVRIIFTYVVPFVLPAIGWYVWRRFVAKPHPPAPSGWRAAPWHWLAVAGAALVAAVLGVTALTGGGRPGEVYAPARIEDGRVVPGETKPGQAN